MNYYKNKNEEFIENTFNCDMSFQYTFFEKYLNKNSKTILDIGFGSGRDSLYFSKKYDVYSIDPVQEFCDYAISLGLKNVYCKAIEDIDYKDYFDGIWACASLLHIKYADLIYAFNKCYNSLKDNGIMYCSFKYGEFEGIRDDRYFTDLTEDRLNNIINNTNFKILEICITNDVRQNKENKWLNVILKKG